MKFCYTGVDQDLVYPIIPYVGGLNIDLPALWVFIHIFFDKTCRHKKLILKLSDFTPQKFLFR